MTIIHVRLRDGIDDDIAGWYEGQEDKSGAVRKALRAYIGLHNGSTQENVVREAVGRELSRLPDIVAAAVREALEGYRLTAARPVEPGAEDPTLAARLDDQLDEFFGG